MKKSFSKLFFLQVIIFCLVVFASCIKREREMKVLVGEVTSVSTNSAVISVNVIDLGEGKFITCGLCWSTAINPTLSNNKTTVGTGKGNFTNNLSGLSAGTKYYVSPYLTTSVGTLIGEGIVITTKDIPSVISTDPVNNANNVALNKVITATFSQPMNPSTIAISTFTLNQGATAVNGTVTYSGTTATFTPSNNLIAGTTYTATITTGAKNSDGIALLNNYTWSFTTTGPSTVPGAPTIGTATPGNAQATVTFTVPSSNGGSPITGYTATSSPGGFTGSGAASPITVSGLNNGTSYTFTVTATNSIGTGPASLASNQVIPSTVPGAPTGVSATPGNTQATVTFSVPVSNGGSVITGYTVTSSPGSIIGTGSTSPIAVSGLTNGTSYTFTVIATNANGNSSQSSASNPVIPTPVPTVPGAPTGVSATKGNAQAIVSFTAPVNNGGSAITGYTVTSSPGGFVGTGTTSPITVTGLINGTPYTFTVTATNNIGTGPTSTASNSVIPSTIPGAPTIITATPGNSQVTVVFTPPVDNGGSSITGYTITFSPGNIIGTGTASPITVTGLTNGTTYTFIVIATNANGNSPPSPVSTIIPSTIPSAPTIGSAIAGNSQATVSFTAPVSNGGSAITRYTVTSSPGGFSTAGTTSPITITGLTNGTTYTFTVTATNINGPGPASSFSNSVIPFPSVSIGTQIWMAENLNTTKYNDGTDIPNVTNDATWAGLISAAYSWYNNNEATYKATYGALYNWYAIDWASNGGKNVCPLGWHVPSQSEWTTLSDFAGGQTVAGGNLKETGFTHWLYDVNSGATDLYGFKALPGGDRNGNDGTFKNLTLNGYWWSSTDAGTGAWSFGARLSGIDLESGISKKTFGFSIRCLKD